MYYVVYTWFNFDGVAWNYESVTAATDPRRSVDAFQTLRVALASAKHVDADCLHIINVIEIGG